MTSNTFDSYVGMSEAITELFKRVILPEEGVGVSEESLIIIVYEYNNIQGDFLRLKEEYIISA